jgi:ADP-heptose:LPS heptosyltransferase
MTRQQPVPEKLGSEPPRTVAVLRALQLGDLLCTVPAFRALRSAFPAARISLIGLPWASDFVVRYGRYLDEWIEFPGFPGLPERAPHCSGFPSFLSAMQERRFDLVLQLQGNGRLSNSVVALLGASRTAGFFAKGGYCPDPDRFMLYPDDAPEVRRHLALLRFLGIPLQGEHLEFPLSPADEAAAALIMEEQGLMPGAYVCMHAGGRGPTRRWAPEKFALVADHLSEQGYRVVMTGTRDEGRLVGKAMKEMRTTAVDLSGRTDLGSLGALLLQAKLLVSNDTGVSHLAAALKVPSVIVCVGSDPLRWSPLDRARHRVLVGHAVRPESVLDEIHDLLCNLRDGGARRRPNGAEDTVGTVSLTAASLPCAVKT